MSGLKRFLAFNKNERKGVFVFFVFILLLQGVYFWVSTSKEHSAENPDEISWLSNQKIIDSLKNISEPKPTLYPFNPNFISDFKGYQLGMSVQEIDKLFEFRKTGKFVNSAKEFQAVTGISDSLLRLISPYFKFPDWVTNPNKPTNQNFKSFNKKEEPIVAQDLNSASQEDLIKVRGIGEKLSERILTHKEKLGAFVSMEQLKEIYGLSEEVIEEMSKYFYVTESLTIKRIKINELSIKELGEFPYFRYPISKNIVVYRSNHGKIRNSEDLAKIPDFPVEKIEIIALYLEF
jgi:DNA uptake protein ComE-like DNA-binding protein